MKWLVLVAVLLLIGFFRAVANGEGWLYLRGLAIIGAFGTAVVAFLALP